MLARLRARQLGFIRGLPLQRGSLSSQDPHLATIAKKLGATLGQVALAGLLRRSKVMLPIRARGIPSISLRELQGRELELSDADFAALARRLIPNWPRRISRVPLFGVHATGR